MTRNLPTEEYAPVLRGTTRNTPISQRSLAGDNT